jgi:hypothetical protein
LTWGQRPGNGKGKGKTYHLGGVSSADCRAGCIGWSVAYIVLSIAISLSALCDLVNLVSVLCSIGIFLIFFYRYPPLFSLLLLCSELHFLGGAGALGWGITCCGVGKREPWGKGGRTRGTEDMYPI